MPSLSEQFSNEDPGIKRNQLLQKIRSDYQIHGKHKMSSADHRNVMLIGRTRTGKSTIKTLLVDPTVVPDDLTLKSGTRDPLFESFHVQDIGLVLNIIDTPGLFERGQQTDEIRDNETIMRTIHMCVNMEITKFHVIGFCIALTSGINSEDIKALEELIKYLGQDLTQNSCLIITHCESKDEEQRNKLREELMNDAFFQSIGSFFKLGVFFSGSLNRDDYNQGNDSVLRQYVTICKYRQSLIDLFTKEIEPFPVCQMLMNRLSTTHDNMRRMAETMTNQRNVEHQRIANELSRTYGMNQAKVDELLKSYREAVAREEKANAEASHYKEGYENLLRHFQRDLPEPLPTTQRK